MPLATECECGHTRNFHTPWGHRMHPCTECTCGNFRVRQEAKPDLRCTCGCLRSQHMGKPRGCQEHAFHAFVCDHSQCGWKPREEPHNFSSPSHCAECSKTWIQCPSACRDGHTYSGSCALRADGPPGREEPPMTPEEEEQAPADLPPVEGPEYTPCLYCGHIEPEHDPSTKRCTVGNEEVRCGCEEYRIEPAPPQPERRPPYAVDYSAGGHAFQVLVPGDAAVLAVDGTLIIRHADFPVLGISCITPLKMEAS